MGRRRHRSQREVEFALERGAEIVRVVAGELTRRQQRRRRRRGPGRAGRVVRALLWSLFASLAAIPLMFAAGYTLGWNGIALLIVALLSTYGGLLHWVLRNPPPAQPPQLPASHDAPAIALLPVRTGDWLEQERMQLPVTVQPRLDSIVDQLDQLAPQVAVLPASHPSAHEVSRLLSEELPQLVASYRKVPRKLTQQPLYGGSTPERQLIDGLDIIDKQLARLHEQLAKDDLHELATHQRYLDLKYKRDDDIE